jgi:hypothetical protein
VVAAADQAAVARQSEKELFGAAPTVEEQAAEGKALALFEQDQTAAYNAFAEGLMTELASKFPNLGGVDRLRLVFVSFKSS